MDESHQSGETVAERLGKLSRRGAIGALGLAGLGFVLFGPRGASGAPDGRVVIDYWEKWTGQEGRAMQRIVDEFNAVQDRIWVRYFSMSAIEQKALISIAGDDPPDLIGLQSFSHPAFLTSNALIPVDKLDEEFGARIAQRMGEYAGTPGFRVRRELYTGPVWRLMGTGGQLGGVVSTCSSMAYYYDKDAYREVGLDPERPPRTIAELDEHADRLTTRDSDGRLIRAGFVHREPGWWNWLWGYFFGGSIYDVEANRVTAASPLNVRAYEWVQSYPERIGSSRLVAFQSGFGGYNSTQQPLLAGKVASAFHGPFLANVIETFQPGFDYGAAPFPVDDAVYDPARPIALIEGDTICVPRGARHPGEAYEFVVFTQLRRNLEAIAKAHAKPSPLADVSPGFSEEHPNRAIAMHNTLVASERAFPKPETPVWPQYEAEFNAEIGTIWDLDAPAAEVLAGIQKRGQGFIDRHAAYQRLRRERGSGGKA